MHNRPVLPMIILFAVMLVLSAPAWGEDGGMAGSVRTIKGQGSVLRGTDAMPAEVGMHILRGDVLRTGPDSSMGVLFRDDTSLALGPDSESVVDDFVFAPAQGGLSMLLKVSKGTAALISGEIAKLKPESMVVSTPLSTIGIRGTRFVVKVEDK